MLKVGQGAVASAQVEHGRGLRAHHLMHEILDPLADMRWLGRFRLACSSWRAGRVESGQCRVEEIAIGHCDRPVGQSGTLDQQVADRAATQTAAPKAGRKDRRTHLARLWLGFGLLVLRLRIDRVHHYLLWSGSPLALKLLRRFAFCRAASMEPGAGWLPAWCVPAEGGRPGCCCDVTAARAATWLP